MAAIMTAITPAEQAALVAWALDSEGPLVEIGAEYGASTLMLAPVARHHGTCLFSIDHHRGDEQAGHKETVQTFLDNIAGVADVVVPIMADTATIYGFRRLIDLKAGFVFLDADHSYDALMADICVARWLLRDGGRLVFHDYGRFDVKDAIENSGLDVASVVETMALVKVTNDES